MQGLQSFVYIHVAKVQDHRHVLLRVPTAVGRRPLYTAVVMVVVVITLPPHPLRVARRPRQHTRRHPGQPSDVEAVRAPRRSLHLQSGSKGAHMLFGMKIGDRQHDMLHVVWKV